MARFGWIHSKLTLAAVVAMVCTASAQPGAPGTPQLRVIEVKEPNGQILSYRHLAGSTEVEMRGTRLQRTAQVRLKIGSRPGFVELDINRGGITGLQPAHRLGADFLTYVLWAVSVDGRASNLGEITFDSAERPVAVNLTTPYQTFWLMVTAEPNYAVVDPSARVVLYSVKQTSSRDNIALPIKGSLFYFTHYASYDSGVGGAVDRVPNQLLQARKAVELATESGVLKAHPSNKRVLNQEEEYAREALEQAKAFLGLAEAAYKRAPSDQAVIQFARTSAQSAENARALAMGAVGGLLVHQLESELLTVRAELAKTATRDAPVTAAAPPPPPPPAPVLVEAAKTEVSPPQVPASSLPTLVRQPALWFAISGWAVAAMLLFRRRSF